MGARTKFIVSLTVLFKLSDYAGDGCMLFLLIQEYFRFNSASTNSFGSLQNLTGYCRGRAYFESNFSNFSKDLTSFAFISLAYCIVVGFSFLTFVPFIRLSIPSDYRVHNPLEEDDTSLTYDFREDNSPKKRGLQIGYLLLLLIVHDVPGLALGLSSFSYLVAKGGSRCFSAASSFPFDSNPIVFPASEDLFLLLFICGKLIGIVGVAAFAVYLEMQYRFHSSVLTNERLRQLFRRHYSRSSPEGNVSPCGGMWFASFLASICLLLSVVVLSFTPTLTVILLRFSDLLSLLSTTFQSTLLYLCYVCWGFWGIFLLLWLIGVWILIMKKKQDE